MGDFLAMFLTAVKTTFVTFAVDNNKLYEWRVIDMYESNNERLISESQAAEFLGYTRRALQAWRFRGVGPRFVKISARSIRYRLCDLISWSRERICSNTVEGNQLVSKLKQKSSK